MAEDIDALTYRCDKCGEGSRSNHLFAPTAYLFGGTRVSLCNECATAWDAYLKQDPAWARQKEYEVRLTLLVGTNGADSKAAELAKERIAIDADAFALSQRWMKGG